MPSYFLGVFLGFMLAHLSSICFAYNLPVMFGLGALPNALQVVLMLTTQSESPATLAQAGKQADATHVVEKFYATPLDAATQTALEQHLAEVLNSSNRAEKLSTRAVYGELFTRYRWNLFVGFMLHVIQQFTGINIIMYYGPSIMKDAGLGGESPRELLLCMIFLSAVNTVGNLIGLGLSSRRGRRELMLKCTVPMGVSLLVLTAAMVANTLSPGSARKTTAMTSSFSLRMGLHCVSGLVSDLLHDRLRITAVDRLF